MVQSFQNGEMKKYAKYMIGTLLIGIIAYFAMMAEELNNNWDGIWHLSNFVAGDFEISLGRGFERYADRLRFGIVSSPLNITLCLILTGVTGILIIRRFELENTFYAWIVIFLLTVNPCLCDTLSYSYLAVNYLLACTAASASFYLLSDPASWQKGWSDKTDRLGHIRRILLGGLLLACSMEFYQAYFCVVCTLLLFYGIRCIVRKTEMSVLKNYYICGFSAIVAGGIFYIVITRLLLFRAGITLADYKGVSDISLVSILLNFPASYIRCYQETMGYIIREHFWMNLEFSGSLALLFLVLCAGVMLYALIRAFKTSVPHFILLLLSILFIPVAACAILVLAVGNIMTTIMGTGLLLCVILFPVFLPEPVQKIDRIVKTAVMVFLAVFGWYALSTVTNDQLALREGRTATVTLSENIVQQLYQHPDMLGDRMVALVGRPGSNPRFAQSLAFSRANEYAQFGLWSTDPRNNRVSWYGVLTNYLGVNLPLCDDETYDRLRQSEAVASMPVFPEEGSVAVVDGIVVVKVSDLYY